MTAGAVNEAGTILRKQIVAMAAHRLEVDEADIELASSRASVRDDPEKSVSFADLAYRSYYEPAQLPPGMAATLEATARFTSQAMIHWANATHACTCEVDVETGHVTLTRYIVSEDVGPMINPNVVEGQIAGGTVQGIGGALLENMVYDDDGNPLSSTFVDYLLPTATEVPPIEYGHVEIPGPGVGGYKGCGEGGAIGSTPAVINAINDALAPLGVTLTRLPASPAAIVELIEQAKHGAPERTTNRGAEQRISSRGARGQDMGGAHRRRARRARAFPAPSCCPSTATSSPARSRSRSARSRCPTRVMRRSRRRTRPRSAWCIKASGKETRGSGNAAALVTAQLKDEGDATHVVITTDLTISGKAAQFGRGVLADVSANLIGQFAKNLEAELLGGAAPSAAATSSAGHGQPQRPRRDAGDSVDLLKVVAVPMAKRYCAGGRRGRRGRGGRLPARAGASAAHPAAELADELQAALARLLAHESRPRSPTTAPTPSPRRLQMLGEFGDDAKILAGGQSLVPMLAMRLTHFENLVDISRVDELKDIELRDDELVVGAGTPHALVGMDDEVADSVPLLTLSTPYIGHFQIRTRGTLGGAIAHADPAAEYAAVALALDATMEAASSRGRREIPAAEFFTGLWETSLAARRDPHRGAVPGVGRPVAASRSRSSPAGTAISPSRAPRSRSSSTATTGWPAAASDCSASARRRCAAPRPRTPSSASPPTPSPQRRSAGSR